MANDPWSPIPAGGQPETSKVLGDDAWGAPAPAPQSAVAVANNDLSIDPFSPVAQKELSDFDLLRNEIEGGTNGKQTNGGKIFQKNVLHIVGKIKQLSNDMQHVFLQ